MNKAPVILTVRVAPPLPFPEAEKKLMPTSLLMQAKLETSMSILRLL